MLHTSTHIATVLSDAEDTIGRVTSKLNKYRRNGMDDPHCLREVKRMLMYHFALSDWTQNSDGSVDDDVDNCLSSLQKDYIVDLLIKFSLQCPDPCQGYVEEDYIDDDYIETCE